MRRATSRLADIATLIRDINKPITTTTTNNSINEIPFRKTSFFWKNPTKDSLRRALVGLEMLNIMKSPGLEQSGVTG